MKQATFFEGVAIALVISIVGSAVFFTLSSVFSASGLFRLLIAGISFTYILYLLARSRERVGRITVVSVWCIAACITWLFVPSFILYLLIHLGLIWLIRSLYFYQSILAAGADLGLNAISFAVAIWAWSNTHSLFISLWCFFLLQALFVAIPRQLRSLPTQTINTDNTHDNLESFERAHRAAEVAVRKLSRSL